MTNETTLLVESKQLFSPISVLHYEFYANLATLKVELKGNTDIQCVVGEGFVPFGNSQKPGLFNYADGVDTMQFLLSL